MIAARSAVRRVPGTPAASRSGSRASNAARSAARASDRVGTHLPGPDPVHLFDRDDPDLAVPDLAGPGRGEDGVDDGLGLVVFHHDLDLDLGHEIHLVLGAPVDLGVPSLASEPLRLDGREPRHAHLAQGLLDVVQPVRLHHRDDELHGAPKRTRPIGREPGPGYPAAAFFRWVDFFALDPGPEAAFCLVASTLAFRASIRSTTFDGS